jgi:LAS superfamily LD-carboxypeptidase LdcB
MSAGSAYSFAEDTAGNLGSNDALGYLKNIEQVLHELWQLGDDEAKRDIEAAQDANEARGERDTDAKRETLPDLMGNAPGAVAHKEKKDDRLRGGILSMLSSTLGPLLASLFGRLGAIGRVVATIAKVAATVGATGAALITLGGILGGAAFLAFFNSFGKVYDVNKPFKEARQINIDEGWDEKQASSLRNNEPVDPMNPTGEKKYQLYRRTHKETISLEGSSDDVAKRVAAYKARKENAAPVVSEMNEQNNTTPAPAAAPPAGGGGAAAGAVSAGAFKFTSKSGSEQSFQALTPGFKTRVIAAATEYHAKTGKAIQINSAKRDPNDQQRLWDESVKAGRPGRGPGGMPIAKPGRSRHEKGTAVDIQNFKDSIAVAAMNRQGLSQGVPGDPVHFQLGTGSPQENADQAPVAVNASGTGSPSAPSSPGGSLAASNMGAAGTGSPSAPSPQAGPAAATRNAGAVSAGTAGLASAGAAAPMIVANSGGPPAPAAPSVTMMMPIPIPIRPRTEDMVLRAIQSVNYI